MSLPPQIESGRELLLEELGKLLTVEETLAKLVLPELLLELRDDELKQVGEVPAGRPAYGLDGLRTEHDAAAPQVVPGARPSVHVAAAMGTEHYEINAYEAAIRLADALGAEDVGGLLRANLDQEVAALGKLGEQADRLAKLTVEQRALEGLV